MSEFTNKLNDLVASLKDAKEKVDGERDKFVRTYSATSNSNWRKLNLAGSNIAVAIVQVEEAIGLIERVDSRR